MLLVRFSNTRRLAGLAATRLPAVVRSKIDPEDVAEVCTRSFFRRHLSGEFQPEHWDALWSLSQFLQPANVGTKLNIYWLQNATLAEKCRRLIRREIVVPFGNLPHILQLPLKRSL